MSGRLFFPSQAMCQPWSGRYDPESTVILTPEGIITSPGCFYFLRFGKLKHSERRDFWTGSLLTAQSAPGISRYDSFTKRPVLHMTVSQLFSKQASPSCVNYVVLERPNIITVIFYWLITTTGIIGHHYHHYRFQFQKTVTLITMYIAGNTDSYRDCSLSPPRYLILH